MTFASFLRPFHLDANGMTLCAGSLGSNAQNDVVAMAKEFGPRVHFAHLRNVKREPDGSFFEADHLAGETDMVRLVAALMSEEDRRRAEGRADAEIPMRPDHGHLLGDDGREARQSRLFVHRAPQGTRGIARRDADGGSVPQRARRLSVAMAGLSRGNAPTR